MPKAEFWLGSGCVGGGTVLTPEADTAASWPFGTTPGAGGPVAAGPAILPLKVTFGVIGVAGVGGSGSTAEASAAGVAAALRFELDFFAAACDF